MAVGQLQLNQGAIRVRQARFAGWFRGKRIIWWWVGIILDVVGAGVLFWQQWDLYNLFLATGLAKVLALSWYYLGLKRLPSAIPDGSNLNLDQLIEGEVLADVAKANNPQQLWQNLLANWQARFFVNRFGLDHQAIATQLNTSPQELKLIWPPAYDLAKSLNLGYISGGCLVVALILSLPNHQAYLAQLKLSPPDLISGLLWQERLKQAINLLGEKPIFGGVGRDWAFGYTPLLNRFANNISSQVEAGTFHLNLEIHQPLTSQIIHTLAQPTKNSVALVGATGVGKTTLAYSVAEDILRGNGPTNLRYDQIMGLNASVLIANTQGRGDLEALVLRLFNEAARSKNIIIFLDDAHLFFSDETGGVNLANILLPIMQSGQVRLLAAINPGAWQKLVATNPDLAAYFNYQAVAEPSEAVTRAVLEDQALAIESQTHTTITYQAIGEAYRLSERYGAELAQPGKAIKVLLAAANYTQSGVVTIGAVQKAIESTLGVKVTEASVVEKTQLLNLETELHQRMVNQEYAVKAVADALRRARAGVKNANRPVGSFLFLGPTGVGKTQLAKALAGVYFGGVDKIIRVDMSEYANNGDEQRLLASELGNNAHTFLSQLRAQPFSVILLDEIEKAHPQVLNLMLQMLDEGQLTDTSGRQVSFKDAIIIATSNAGADEIRQHIAAGQGLEQFSAEFIDNLISQRQFLPELINRFDEVVLFRPLAKAELKQVVDLMMEEINQELGRQKVAVSLSEAAKDWLVETGNDPRLGARPLRRTIQRTVENVVAKRLLEGSVQAGQTVELNASDLERAVNA